MKTAIIIVNYNQKKLLRACLISLREMKQQPREIIVVDNKSSDGVCEMLESDFPEVVCVALQYNTGFCKGNNIGIVEAFKRGCDSVVLLNNDTEVGPLFLESLQRPVDDHEKIGMVAAHVVQYNDRARTDSAGLLITPDGLAKTRGYMSHIDSDLYDQNIFCPSGTAAFFSRSLLEDIKQDDQYFDEDFRFYVEEVDLGWRARLRGWHCAYAPDAVVYHHRRASSDNFPALRIFHANRNLYYNIIKNYPGGWSMFLALALAIIRYPALAIMALYGKGAAREVQGLISIGKTFMLIMRGLGDVARNLPRMLRKRRYIQNRLKTDNPQEFFHKYGVSFVQSLTNL